MHMFRLPNPSWFLAIFLIAAVAFVGCDSLSTTEDDGDGFDPSAELTKLSGEWVLFDGNNPSTIGSEIEISGNQGTLTSVAGGSLQVGDVKWDDITPKGTSEYDHQELGSDRNYYDASMRLQDDSTLTITVDAAGAGNQQTWTRKGTRGTGQNNAELAKIAGDWIRIGGNNARNEGMEVQVDGNTGTVTDPASSGFRSGDVKWDQITPRGNSAFEHLELGSDGNYYDGTITLLNDTTLAVSVASAGTGNEQTWARAGTQDRNTGEAITLSCSTATEDLTLPRFNQTTRPRVDASWTCQPGSLCGEDRSPSRAARSRKAAVAGSPTGVVQR